MSVQAISQNSPTSATATSPGSSTTTSANSSAGDLGTTFMNLLITELQSQDPTSPMDPTEMVGQMISLNQLDQLMSINQLVQSIANAVPSTTSIRNTNGGQ
ncbi:MAG: flagellar hook capping FlgD N-terminal domain-containing protein [Candidatus Korobacteraceae bacterium]|jgi:flagellar basal-body rod modification protein FlgD